MFATDLRVSCIGLAGSRSLWRMNITFTTLAGMQIHTGVDRDLLNDISSRSHALYRCVESRLGPRSL